MGKSEQGQKHSDKVWVDFKNWRNEPKPQIEKKPKVFKQQSNRLDTLEEPTPKMAISNNNGRDNS